MKRFYRAFIVIPALLACSCIQKEPLSQEADIVSVELPGTEIKDDPIIRNESIMMLVFKGLTDRGALAPEFTVSQGATIDPASGTTRDFTSSQQYTVTSQDRKWSKTYTISIIDADLPTEFDFENWERQGSKGKYENPYETPAGQSGEEIKMTVWSSGNAGYSIIQGEIPTDFPTCSSTDAYTGHLAAKLETKLTGFDALPLAAGNLFLGSFDAASAMANPLGATHFGVPFGEKPLKITGYYKYEPGPSYTMRGKPMPEMTDACRIYAILYEKGDGIPLNGTSVENFDDPRIVAVADAGNPPPVGDYTKFDIDFDYDSYPGAFDNQKSKTYKYYLAVVFSSSYGGAEFNGAAGSTLFVDSVKIICEE